MRSWGLKGLKTLVTDFGSSEIKSLNPLTPISDEHVTSPCNIHTLSSQLETKILKVISKKLVVLIYHQVLVIYFQGIV